MSFVSELLQKQMANQVYSQAKTKLGVDDEKSQGLIDKALPALLQGMAKNIQTEGGAKSLIGALQEKKHDGSILSSNADFFAESNLDEGDKILKHLLGDTRDDIAEALAAETKTDTNQAKKALQALSPIVMGAVGKMVQSKKLNADELGSILKMATEKGGIQKVAQRVAVLLWDKDNDGKVKDDLFEMAKKWVGGLINKKKQ